MLLTAKRTALPPRALLAEAGEVFAVFDARTQDSGNVSYGVSTEEGRFFVKTAGSDPVSGPLTFEARVALLRNAVRLHRSLTHPALPRLRNVVESAQGPILVYDWVDGELLGARLEQRTDPASAYLRFRRLPVPRVLRVLDSIIGLHVHVAACGWIAVDFYDGSIIYDFANAAVHIVDLDSYHFGAFTNRVGRLFGSSRFMAPEEFQLGAEITERTNVFMLGRTVLVLLSDGGDGGDGGDRGFRGPPELWTLAQRACRPDVGERFGSVRDFATVWLGARASLERSAEGD